MRGLEEEYQGRIAFNWVNVLEPENEPLMEFYGFSSPPELYLVNPQGDVLDFWDEFIPPEELHQALDFALEQ